MNFNQLRAFGIELKHHLAAEQELFDAGLIDQPVVSEPEAAKFAGTIVVHVKQPFQLRRRVKQIPDLELKPIHRTTEGISDSTITVSEHTPNHPDFEINLQRRPNPLDGMDFNPRRRV